MYTAKNHSDGPDKTVIGGELEIAVGGKLTFGGNEVKTAAFQADSTATEVAGLVTDFNALLAKLKTAGLMAAE